MDHGALLDLSEGREGVLEPLRRGLPGQSAHEDLPVRHVGARYGLDFMENVIVLRRSMDPINDTQHTPAQHTKPYNNDSNQYTHEGMSIHQSVRTRS